MIFIVCVQMTRLHKEELEKANSQNMEQSDAILPPKGIG